MSRKTTPTYVLLNQITLAATSSSVTFSNIPQNYGDLILITNARASTDIGVRTTFNGDSGSNYSVVVMRGTGTSTSSGASTQASLDVADAFTTQGYMGIFQIMDYSATDKQKTTLLRKGGAFEDVQATAGRWANTAAINRLNITVAVGSLNIGSTFSLYGLVA